MENDLHFRGVNPSEIVVFNSSSIPVCCLGLPTTQPCMRRKRLLSPWNLPPLIGGERKYASFFFFFFKTETKQKQKYLESSKCYKTKYWNQSIKRIMHHDQMQIFPEMEGWSNIWKSFSVIHILLKFRKILDHFNRHRKKNLSKFNTYLA